MNGMIRFLRLILLVLTALAGCVRPGSSAPVEITDFTYPWDDQEPPSTLFRAHTQDARLHFHFIVEDPEVVVEERQFVETTVDGEDRVEIFFAKDESLTDYWCIEIDPLGRVHDYHARFYREFDADWDCPGLEAAAEPTPTGYEVTASIPLQSLEELLGRPVQPGTSIRIGLFRADFFGPPGATRGASTTNWISWVRPRSPQPDFHIPSAFRLWTVP